MLEVGLCAIGVGGRIGLFGRPEVSPLPSSWAMLPGAELAACASGGASRGGALSAGVELAQPIPDHIQLFYRLRANMYFSLSSLWRPWYEVGYIRCC